MASRVIRKKNNSIDASLLFYVFILILFGIVMIYSTTVYKEGYASLKSQLVATIIGIVLMFVVSGIPFKKIPNLYFILHGVALLSVFMLLTPLKITLNNATRWFRLFGFSVQSAEVVKLALILILAQYLSQRADKLRSIKTAWKVWLIPVFYAGLLGVVSNNLSSAIIILAIGAVMIIMVVPDIRPYLAVAVVVAALVTLIVVLIKMNLIDLGFRSNRVLVWLDPEGQMYDVDNFQTIQALYAIGSGGIFGKGIGEGIQKINKIPEAQNDMIFSVLCEELGLFGAFTVIIFFMFLIFRLVKIASRINNFYDKLLVTGVAAHISIQAVLNIAVVTNLIPNTGVSLPFISYGGSSVLFLLVEIGLVLNVSKGINKDE